MAPSKASRSAADDHHKPDAPGPKEKSAGHHAPAKMRRGASQMSASQLREAPTSAPAQPAADAAPPTLNWSSLDRETLHAYCREHQLNTPTSFSSSYHQWVLSRPGGIGLYSPTMVCKSKHRRQGKEQLAMAVRKHFNGMGIQENDVIVDFIYKVRSEKAAKATGPNKQGFLVAN
ncbi:hypothetical protein OCS_02564 [Ophiocordyceps sinensis CO18]|nr:hypothetical protein OCS_02564 [Ophiocordyceps sinensis CO18]